MIRGIRVVGRVVRNGRYPDGTQRFVLTIYKNYVNDVKELKDKKVVAILVPIP